MRNNRNQAPQFDPWTQEQTVPAAGNRLRARLEDPRLQSEAMQVGKTVGRAMLEGAMRDAGVERRDDGSFEVNKMKAARLAGKALLNPSLAVGSVGRSAFKEGRQAAVGEARDAVTAARGAAVGMALEQATAWGAPTAVTEATRSAGSGMLSRLRRGPAQEVAPAPVTYDDWGDMTQTPASPGFNDYGASSPQFAPNRTAEWGAPIAPVAPVPQNYGDYGSGF